MMRAALFLGVLSMTVACGSGGDDAASGSGGSAGAAGASGGAGGAGTGGSGATGGSGGIPGGESFDITFDAGTIQPGVSNEDTKCIIKRLGNPNPIHVGRIHNVISSSSHHLIVYKTTDTTERLEPFACTPFLDTLDPSKGAPLMVTQKHDDTLQLPPNVAFNLEANQMIRLELHYINTTTAPVDVSSTTTFHTMPDSEYQHEADFLFVGSPDIDIAPRSQATLGPMHFTLPGDYAGVNFFAITGHTHSYGTNVGVDVAASATAAGTPVYDVPNWKWDEPATVVHDPPFQIPSGGGFTFTCEWDNTSGNRLTFGESATQEMCFFWAYYYPSQGPKVCVKTEQYGGGISACCPGNPLCALIPGFLGN